MAKKANGEGTISARRDKDGKVIGYRGAVTVGYGPDGKPQRRWVSGKRQAEVVEKMRALQADLHTGMLADTDGITVGEYLDRWLKARESSGIKPNTYQSYVDTVRRYLKPHLGRLKLEKLRPLDVQQLLHNLRGEGRSVQVQRYSLTVLRMALKQAVLWQMVPRNVAEAVQAPRQPKREMQVWTAQEVATFLGHTEGHHLHAAFYLMLMSGLRRGELLGLHWRDLDLTARRLSVKHNLVEVQGSGIPGKQQRGKATVSSKQVVLDTPKTNSSRRTVVLSQGTVALLQTHQRQQKAERQSLGETWTPDLPVFTSELGGFILPNYFSKVFKGLAREAGVPDIRLHDLRHTAASLMIQRGIPAKTVSDRLGHADVAFTLRTYTHLYEEQKEEAAFDLSDLFPSAAGAVN